MSNSRITITNKMSTAKQEKDTGIDKGVVDNPQAEAQEQAEIAEATNALVRVDPQSLAAAGGFDGVNNELLASIAGDIETSLRQLAVQKFEGPRLLLDRGISLHDAFPFQFTEEGVEKAKVMYVISDQENGGLHNIMQSTNAQRERFITLYSQVKTANALAGTNKQLTLTNLVFQEVGQPKKGNKPIALMYTPETKVVWS